MVLTGLYLYTKSKTFQQLNHSSPDPQTGIQVTEVVGSPSRRKKKIDQFHYLLGEFRRESAASQKKKSI